jgi:hypothetical protein
MTQADDNLQTENKWNYSYVKCCQILENITLSYLLMNRTSVASKFLQNYGKMLWPLIRTYILTYLPTYLLTPWCKVLLEKLTGSHLVKKFPAFYGTRRFITALTSARRLSLSWASWIQSIPPHSTSWRSILTLSSHFIFSPASNLYLCLYNKLFALYHYVFKFLTP